MIEELGEPSPADSVPETELWKRISDIQERRDQASSREFFYTRGKHSGVPVAEIHRRNNLAWTNLHRFVSEPSGFLAAPSMLYNMSDPDAAEAALNAAESALGQHRLAHLLSKDVAKRSRRPNLCEIRERLFRQVL